MLRDVTLGQFFPGNSLLHRIDPRMKIIISIAYIVAIFMAKSALSYGLVVLFTLLIILISQIKISTLLKSIKPILFIVVITVVINLFFYGGNRSEPIISFWIVKIYLEGIINAAYMIVRIICVVIGTSVILTYTTSPIALTDGLEQMLMPLAKIHLPVHEFSMMMTIALRFVPTIISETDKIMSAQKARGASFSSGSIIARAKAFIPILIPLFISSFKRADELATAMECRCYRGGTGRTKMNKLKFSIIDLFAFIVFGIVIAGIVLINNYFVIWVV